MKNFIFCAVALTTNLSQIMHNPFQATGFFLYLVRKSKNHRFDKKNSLDKSNHSSTTQNNFEEHKIFLSFLSLLYLSGLINSDDDDNDDDDDDDDDNDDELLLCITDQRKTFSLIFSRDHCQRSSPSRITVTQRAGFESAQNLSSGFVEKT